MWHLGRVLAFGGLLAAFAFLAAPEEVVAQKKDKGKVADNGYGATPADYVAIQNRKELTGSIASISGKVVTLRVDSPHMEPNPKFKPITNPKQAGYNPQAANQYKQVQDMQRLQKDLQQAKTANNPIERQRAMQRYYQDMARMQTQLQREYQQMMQRAMKDTGYKKNIANNVTDPFIVVHSYKEYDLETVDAVQVRKTFLAFEYDDMGNIKQYTEKEKAELRGGDKSSYKSTLEEFAAGMEARLTLVPPKKKAKEAKADDEGVGNVDRPTVSMVLLTKDAPGGGLSPADPKKKKDKK